MEQMGRLPTTEKDMWLCYLDRTVTIDEMHKDAKSTSLSNMWAMRAAARWGQEYGVPVMIAGNVAELRDMPLDHRQLSWYFADRARERQRRHGKTGPERNRMITRVVARENEKCSNEKVVQWYAKEREVRK